MRHRKLCSSILALVLVVVTVLSPWAPVQAATADQLEEELDRLEEEKASVDAEIKALRGKLSANAHEVDEIVAKKDLIDQEIFLLHQQQENINLQITSYSTLIADKQAEVEAAQLRLDEVSEKNKARIRAMEKHSTVSYWSVIFQATTLIDMLDRLNTIQKISEADQKCLEELQQASYGVIEAKTALETEMAALEATKAELTATETSLEQRRMEADALLAQAVAKGQEYEQLIADSEEKQDQLMDEIAKAEKAYDAATKPPQTVTPTTPTTKPTTGSKWLVPCSYVYLSSPFGYRYHPLSGKWKMHKGVDLAAPEGTPIYATRSGYVSRASYEEGGAGYYVSINHGDGYASIYMHMTHYVVSVNQYVEQGQVIGYVGSTGGSTGNHLHFGISYNGTYVNPADYMKL